MIVQKNFFGQQICAAAFLQNNFQKPGTGYIYRMHRQTPLSNRISANAMNPLFGDRYTATKLGNNFATPSCKEAYSIFDN